MLRWIAPLAACIVTGCTTVETRPISSGQPGIAYQLPIGKMRLRVVEDDGVVSVLLDGPLVTGDPDNVLVAKLPQSGVADNNVTVTIDPKTNLLSKVDVTSTGKLTEILTNATKSIIFLQASDASTGTTLFAGIYSVDDLPAAAQEANAKLVEYFDAKCRDVIASRKLPIASQLGKAGQTADQEKSETKDRLLRCRKMILSGADTAMDDGGLIRIFVWPASAIRPAPPPFPGARVIPASDTAACARGICYRPNLPRAVSLDVRGAFRLSDVFLLPDTGRLVHVDLPSGVTAEQKYVLDFTDGVLTKYQRDGKSELVGVASLPFKIVEAALSAPAEGLGLKQKNIEARSDYLDALGTFVDKQKTAQEKCKDAVAACPGTAYKLIGGPVSNETQGSRRPGDSDTPSSPQPTPTPTPAATGVPTDTG